MSENRIRVAKDNVIYTTENNVFSTDRSTNPAEFYLSKFLS